MTTLPLRLPGGLLPGDLAFAKQDGLVPGVVQDARTLEVLMVGYLDQEAVETTLRTGAATFFSRSRRRAWTKGESSGHTLAVQEVLVDCDQDTLLLRCVPAGPTCHTGARTCFEDPDAGSAPEQAAGEPARGAGEEAPAAFLQVLDDLVRERESLRPAGSYTTSLFDAGVRRIAQKVGEEGVETALAGVVQDEEALLGESADLLYHLLVLLRSRGLGLAEVTEVLRHRHG